MGGGLRRDPADNRTSPCCRPSDDRQEAETKEVGAQMTYPPQPPGPYGSQPPDPYGQQPGPYGQQPQPDPYSQPTTSYQGLGTYPSGPSEPPPPKKSNTGTIIAIVLVALLVLGGGGAAVYF